MTWPDLLDIAIGQQMIVCGCILPFHALGRLGGGQGNSFLPQPVTSKEYIQIRHAPEMQTQKRRNEK